MKKWLTAGVAVVVGMTVVLPGVAHAADKVIVVPQDFVRSLSDTRATGHYEIAGTGLHISTEGSTSTDKVAEYVSSSRALAGVGEPSLDYTPTFGGLPGFQLIVDFDNDKAADGILVGEKIYGNDWWASNGSAQFVKNAAPSHAPGSGSDNHGTLDEWRTAFPAATVLAFGFSLGSGVHGDGVLNAINLGGDRYTFTDKAPDTTAPTVTCDIALPGPDVAFGSTTLVTATVTDAGSGPAAVAVSGAADTASLGTKTITLTGTDNAGNTASATCAYTVVAGAPTQLTVVSGSGQKAAVGTAFAQPVRIRVTDAGGNPVGNVGVTFTAPPNTGASGTFTSTTVTTGQDGIASVNVTANAKTGVWQGSATTGDLTAGFSLTNTPAPPKKADLRVTLTGPSEIARNKSGTYTVTVRNLGPDTATDVLTSVVLPCTIVSVTLTGGGQRAGSLVVFPTAKSLASGASVTYTVTVKATAKGSGVVAAGAASLRTGDPVLANNAAAVKLTVR
ncbi:CARDB domain-containing protein [Nakamurella deserti]|uniref:CARDB domain-containing protein n=1 Tax=Nakamurella deserti TaxID=2164074 RepID=UPI001300924C|nr:CARDB domain-containing protein [Nakamurella deserti]